jgi:hypothetical protein
VAVASEPCRLRGRLDSHGKRRASWDPP